MPFVMMCRKCEYTVAGIDEEMANGLRAVIEEYPESMVCEFCGGEPVVSFVGLEQYNEWFRELKVSEGTLVFVLKAPKKEG